jgi:hypothetical protein
MDRLVKDLLGSNVIQQSFLEVEIEDVRKSISLFSAAVPKFRATLRVCLFVRLRDEIY